MAPALLTRMSIVREIPREFVDLVAVGEIGGDDVYLHAACLADLLARRGEIARAARDQDHVAAFGGESLCSGAADAFGCAGDQGGFAGQLQIHRVRPLPASGVCRRGQDYAGEHCRDKAHACNARRAAIIAAMPARWSTLGANPKSRRAGPMSSGPRRTCGREASMPTFGRVRLCAAASMICSN